MATTEINQNLKGDKSSGSKCYWI